MKTHSDFDELARRKLAERSFPFEEADWVAMQRVIAERSGTKRRFAYWLVSAFMLILLPLAWWWLSASVSERPSEDLSHVNVSAQVPNTPSEPPLPAAGAVVLEKHDEGSDSVRTGREVDAGPAGSTLQASALLLEQPEQATTASSAKLVSDRRRTASNKALSTSHAYATVPHATAPGNGLGGSREGSEGMHAPQHVPHADEDVGGPVEYAPSEPVAFDDDVGLSGNSGGSSPAAATGGDPVSGPPDEPASATPVSSAASPLIEAAPNGPEHIPNEVNANDPPVAAALATPVVPQDSSNTALEPVDLGELVPHNAPWEIGLLAGAVHGYSRYSGGSRDWANDVDPLWTAVFGIEAMRMGSNFGIGTGLHAGSYAERIHAGAIDRTVWNTTNFWYLTTIDTTILFITDTIQQGGETWYNGQSVNVSVPVLVHGVDSNETISRVREARRTTNRVSYLEVPLLLDAHLVQGRWSLGLRGGPTIGLLTGRQGEVPNTTNDGYVGSADMPFREVVFGYTARAYVRYRFNAGWSLGLEPVWRGQFGNTLSGGELVRRTGALGGMLSVAYRLK